MTYENLLEEAANDDVYIIENANFKSKAAGLIRGSVIGLNRNITTNRKRSCVLAEELGHYHTTVGDIIGQSSVSDIKQELRARAWAYNKMIGLSGIISAYEVGCRTLSDMAEHLDVTEDFLSDALRHYTDKYGICTQLDNYIIYFKPTLGVFELR